jgi:hypothetical protein
VDHSGASWLQDPPRPRPALDSLNQMAQQTGEVLSCDPDMCGVTPGSRAALCRCPGESMDSPFLGHRFAGPSAMLLTIHLLVSTGELVAADHATFTSMI